MKAYESGQISGLTWDEYSDLFAKTEALLLSMDWEPVNPLKVIACEAEDCNPGVTELHPGTHTYLHSWKCYLRYDIKEMLDCEAIVMLPNWLNSEGAQFEKFVAEKVGMKVYYVDNEILEVTDEFGQLAS
jgi:hypothetical protein